MMPFWHCRGYLLVLVRMPLADIDQIEMLLKRAWFAAAPKRLTKTLSTTALKRRPFIHISEP